MMVNKTEIYFWLLFYNTKQLTHNEKIYFLEKYTLKEIFLHIKQQSLPQICIDKQKKLSKESIESSYFYSIMTWLKQHNTGIINYHSPHYPVKLKMIYQPPLLLFYQGDINLLHYPSIAIVGSRKATQYGLNITYEWSKMLSQSGWVIISGLAKGIDTMAHQGALPKTIAVLGNGLSHHYPKENITLQDNITQQGLVLSEYTPNTTVKKHHFPRRNRIVSGLSHHVLITEAKIKSGSLITAKIALEQGKNIFTISSHIENEHFSGNHWLLKQGATLATSIDDINTLYL